MGYVTRTMTRDEVAMAVDWAAQEGWNPGLHDAASFHAADPEGFFVGDLDGQPIASISVVKYGSAFAFLGLYIVRPDQRGHGYGWTLWQHGMRSAAGRLVGLDGVVAQQANYRKSGFELAWRNVRYEGHGMAPQKNTDPRIVELHELPFDTLAAYDAPFFPAVRQRFLRAWISQPDAACLGYVTQGRLFGYGVIRRCRRGWKIGPLFADGEAIAESLHWALTARAGSAESVFLDISEPNARAAALARRHGMKVVFETARMYTGPAPKVPMDRLFGMTTFELG